MFIHDLCGPTPIFSSSDSLVCKTSESMLSSQESTGFKNHGLFQGASHKADVIKDSFESLSEFSSLSINS